MIKKPLDKQGYADIILRAAGCGLRAAGCGLRAAGCGLRAAGCGADGQWPPLHILVCKSGKRRDRSEKIFRRASCMGVR